MNSKIRKKLRDILANNRAVKLAYLFGSQAIGQDSILSDYDVAVFLKEDILPSAYAEIKFKLTGDLVAVLGMDKVDLVILNTAPTMLKHLAVNYGEIIYYQDKEKCFALEHRALQEFEDFLPHFKVQYNLQKQAIEQGTFGQTLIKN